MANVQGYTSLSPTNEKQMAEDELDLRKSPVRKDEDCHIRAASGSDSGTTAGATRASESSTYNNESCEKKAELADNIVDLTTEIPFEGSRRAAPRISTNLRHYRRMRGKGKLLTQDVGTSSISILGPEPTTCYLSERTRYLTDLDARSESFNEASVSRSEATDVLESAQSSFSSSSSGREETVRLTHAREGEDLTVPNSVQHISTQSEKVLPIKRRRSSLMNPSNGRQRFRPPRLLRDRHASVSTSGAMQTPIEVDDLESPCAGPQSNSRYQDMQNQIDEDEMLAKLLQEEYSLQASSESPLTPTDICEETCSICLEIPVVGNLVRRLPCMHGFHQQCIDVWLQRQANCPICKVNL